MKQEIKLKDNSFYWIKLTPDSNWCVSQYRDGKIYKPAKLKSFGEWDVEDVFEIDPREITRTEPVEGLPTDDEIDAHFSTTRIGGSPSYPAHLPKREGAKWLRDTYGTALQGKVNFYREQTAKLREYLEFNKIGKPNQKLFDALYEHVSNLQQENAALKERITELEKPTK